ncbi:MAG: ArsR/SmtB family transcription factor [Christensenellales bacterium]
MMLENQKKIKDSLKIKADLFKTLSHPVRLCILYMLLEKGRSKVMDLQLCIEVSQSTVSQHIAKLKSAGIIVGDREGTEIYYSIKNDGYKRMLAFMLKDEK